jgi:hypothetical protein
MKYYLSILLLISFGCASKETKEIKHLMESLLSEEINKLADTVLIRNHAVSDWVERAQLESCHIGDMIMDREWGLGLFKAENFQPEDFLTASDSDKLCRESIVEFQFGPEHVPKGVTVVTHDYIEKLLEETELYDGTSELKTFAFYHFSKPVFFQRYRYAFLYYERHSIVGPMTGMSKSLLFFEKSETGEWNLILSQTLIMA